MSNAVSAFWQKHDAQLRQLAEVEGLSTKEAAARLGVTKNQVIARAYRLRLNWTGSAAGAARSPKASRQQPQFPERGDQCRWPLGDLRNGDFHCCGAPVPVFGASYCHDHMLVVHLRPRP